MTKNVDTSVTTPPPTPFRLTGPECCVKANKLYLLAIYNFLVADYRYSAATLSYKSL